MPCATENEDYKLIKEVEKINPEEPINFFMVLNLGFFNSFSKYASLYNSRRGSKGLGVEVPLDLKCLLAPQPVVLTGSPAVLSI
jgi:hypothetical protein